MCILLAMCLYVAVRGADLFPSGLHFTMLIYSTLQWGELYFYLQLQVLWGGNPIFIPTYSSRLGFSNVSNVTMYIGYLPHNIQADPSLVELEKGSGILNL